MAHKENIITLNNLQYATRDDRGLLVYRNPSVDADFPKSCSQHNSNGTMQSFENLDKFRENARSSGAKFRKLLTQ